MAVLLTAAIVPLLGAAALFAAFVHLTGQAPAALLEDLRGEGGILLYEYGMVDELSAAEVTRLYRGRCTRRCHGRDVIEQNPRTAAEWESVVARMKATDRAAMSDRLADAIARHLQNHFLSNIPTVLPPATMRFVRQHLWRSDFGDNDLFLDIIYVPREHLRLLRYLGVRDPPHEYRNALFVVFINTHRGSVPPWNLGETSTLRVDGRRHDANGWEVLYRDGQQHHKQGLLTFPAFDPGQSTELEVTVQLSGLGTRTFQWRLPVPPLAE
jgi:hypothetical protein